MQLSTLKRSADKSDSKTRSASYAFHHFTFASSPLQFGLPPDFLLRFFRAMVDKFFGDRFHLFVA